MHLAPGTRLGAYEVFSILGASSMGEVSRARDAKLKREVAIKVLPDAFLHDPERLARFQREAELLATSTIRTSLRCTASKKPLAEAPSSSSWFSGGVASR